jgi:hypothetical protein
MATKKATKKRVLTKRVMVHSNVRLSRYDRDRSIEAATKLGISRSEFFRAAIKEKTEKVLTEELKLSA